MVIDLILVGYLLLFAIIGFFRGLINQLFSVAGLIICLVYGREILGAVENRWHPGWPPALGFLFVVLMVYTISSVIGYLVELIVARRGGLPIGSWNPILGCFFGTAKATLFAVVVIYALHRIEITSSLPRSVADEVRSSSVISWITRSGWIDRSLSSLLPAERLPKPPVVKFSEEWPSGPAE